MSRLQALPSAGDEKKKRTPARARAARRRRRAHRGRAPGHARRTRSAPAPTSGASAAWPGAKKRLDRAVRPPHLRAMKRSRQATSRPSLKRCLKPSSRARPCAARRSGRAPARVADRAASSTVGDAAPDLHARCRRPARRPRTRRPPGPPGRAARARTAAGRGRRSGGRSARYRPSSRCAQQRDAHGPDHRSRPCCARHRRPVRSRHESIASSTTGATTASCRWRASTSTA